MSKKPITVVTVDDHALIREAIRGLLSESEDIFVVGEGSAGEQVLSLVAEHKPDVLLLDLRMPQYANNSSEEQFPVLLTLAEINKQYRDTRVIILSQYAPYTLVQGAVREGINGYLLKGDDLSLNLVDAINVVYRKGVFFSRAVSDLLMQTPQPIFNGKLKLRHLETIFAKAKYPDNTYAELASMLHISESTFKGHLRNAYKVLGVSNIMAAIIFCVQTQLIPYSFDEYGRLEFGDCEELGDMFLQNRATYLDKELDVFLK